MSTATGPPAVAPQGQTNARSSPALRPSAPRPEPPLRVFAKAVAGIYLAACENWWRGPWLPGQRRFGTTDLWFVNKLQGPFNDLEKYHDYRIVGLKNFPRQGPAIVLFEHSLVTLDIVALCKEVLAETGRVLHPLIASQLINTPILGKAALDLGAVSASHENMRRLLDAGEMVLLAPDGVRGWVHPTDTRKYEVDWGDRQGFVIKALQSGVPVLVAACPGADDVFDVYDNLVTRRLYRHLRVPVPMFTGKYGIPCPLAGKPATLVHVVREPIHLPHVPDLPNRYSDLTPKHKKLVDTWHRKLSGAMNEAIIDALAERIEPGRLGRGHGSTRGGDGGR